MLLKCKQFIHEYVEKVERQTKRDPLNPKISNLSSGDWETIAHIVDVLAIPHEITVKLQRVNYTLSDFYGQYLVMENDIESKISENNSDLARNIFNELNFYKGRLLVNPMLICSIFLDPRFVRTMTATQKTFAVSKLTEIWL